MTAKTIDSIHSGHRQRMKDMALAEGLDGFSPHQVLELLLFYTMPYKDTNELAHKLVDHFGSFSGVLNADYEDLMSVEGVGPHTACMLALLPEIFRRYQLDAMGDKIHLPDPQSMGDYVRRLFIGCRYEVFYLIGLDNGNHVIHSTVISKGSLTEVSVYPRLVVEAALRCRARKVVLAHNHPSGNLRPSAADVQLTQRLKALLDEIGITVLDHVIASGDTYYSFAEKGLLSR